LLIVSQIDPETRPTNIGPPYTGHFRITADAPRGLQPFQPPPGIVTTPGKPHLTTERTAGGTSSKINANLELRKNIYDSSGNKVSTQTNGEGKDEEENGEKRVYNCFSCGVNCTRVRYHSTRSARTPKQIELCPNCFLEGRFPGGSQNSDYVRMEDPAYATVDRDVPWSDQETLLLLEGIEMSGDDWNAIANHVGTKTREQCVVRFLQLPIEDSYLEEKPEQLGPLQYNRVPLSQADSPVMSVVAFLASIVDPKVAAAAAHSSIQEMTKNLSLQVNSRKDAKTDGKEKDAAPKEKSPEAGKDTPAPDVKAEGTAEPDSNMDIDAPEASVNNEGAETATEATSESNKEDEDSAISKAASIALGVSAARAAALASYEEREMMQLVNVAVNHNLRKLDMKLSQFNELEQILQAERREIEKAQQQLFLERLAMKSQCQRVQEQLKRALQTGGQEGYQMAVMAAQMGSQGQKLVFERSGAAPSAAGGIPQQSARPPSLDPSSNYTVFEA